MITHNQRKTLVIPGFATAPFRATDIPSLECNGKPTGLPVSQARSLTLQRK
jgi:hypothetical protein